MGVSYSPKTVTDGLVFYIDPANPRSYVSGSLTSYNLINNPSISGSIQDDGMYNSNSSTCWEFDGTDDYIRCNYNLPSGSVNFSVSAWVKAYNAYVLSPVYILFDNRNSVLEGMSLFIQSGFTKFRYGGADQTQWSRPYPTETGVGTYPWVNVVATYDPSVGKKIYFNSTQVGLSDSSTEISYYISSSTTVGNASYTDGGWLRGSVSDFKIYSRTLSGDEVTQNYNALKDRFTPNFKPT